MAVDVDGRPIAWRETGSQPTTLVLLHGLGGSRISWEPQLEALGDLSRVVAWDAPGYGASAPCVGELTFELLADAVLELGTTLGVARFHLAGHSFGGMIAQYVAAAAPERVASLTLLATSPKFGLDGTQPGEWRAARLAPFDAGATPADIAPAVLGSLAGPAISPRALAQQVEAMARIPAAALRAAIDCLVTHDSRSVLSQIAAPTVVVVGALDQETPPTYAQAIADGIADARLEVLDGAGHLLNAEAPEAVNAILRRQITGEGS